MKTQLTCCLYWSCTGAWLLLLAAPLFLRPAPALSTRAFVNLVCRLFRSLRCLRTYAKIETEIKMQKSHMFLHTDASISALNWRGAALASPSISSIERAASSNSPEHTYTEGKGKKVANF